MLLFPGSPLDRLWILNPEAQRGFVSLGSAAIALMCCVCVACGSATIGLYQMRRWGLISAIVVLAVDLLGDCANALIQHDWRTLIGLPIGGAMMVYLIKKRHLFQ
jgi:hypothetical protein